MTTRTQFRRILPLLLALLCGPALSAQAGSQPGGPAEASRPIPAPLVRLPELPATAPASAATVLAAPGSVKPMAATSSAVNSNPTSLYTAPFAHDYSPGGVYGDYGVYTVVYGDFRHNGNVDAVGLSVDGILTVMGNDGKGHFTQVSSNLSQTANFVNVSRAFAVDLDGDGWLDVMALDIYQAGYIVWKNQGGGKFAAAVRTDLAVPLAAGSSVQANSMAIGDLDGDGRTDMVVGYTITDSVNGGVRLVLAGLKGNGDGTFQAPLANAGLALPYSATLQRIELADMHNAGTLDIVANVGIFSNIVSGYVTYAVVQGTRAIRPGELTLPSQSTWIIGSLARGGSYVVRDVDGDGNQDIFASPGINDVYLVKGDGKGNLAKPQSVLHTDTINVGCTLGDFNRDGYLDAAVFSDGLINIFNGLGGGAFSRTFVHQYPASYATPPIPAAIDLNGDTVPDFAEADGLFNNLVSFLNDGTGKFRSATAIRSSNVDPAVPSSTRSSIYYSVLATGDFNGDGLMDVLAQEGNSYVDIGLNDAKGGFNFSRTISAATASRLHLNVSEPVLADFNGDGFQDLVFASYNGVVVGLSDGKGGVQKWVTTNFSISPNCNPSVAAAGDLDGDGKVDLVLPYAGDSFCGVYPSVISSGYFILKGDGMGGFATTFTPGGTAFYSARLADMNHDGKLDILLDDVGDHAWNITLVAGNGTATPSAQPVQVYTSGSLLYDFTVDDLNGDGNPDLIVSQKGVDAATDSTRAGVVMLPGNGDLTVGAVPAFLVDGDYATSLTTADMNHDGRMDVVAALYPASKLLNGLAIVRSKGDGTFQLPDIYPTPIEANQHFNPQVYIGPFQAVNSTDVVMGGGNEYVPSVLFQNAANTSLQLTVNRASAALGDSVGMDAQLSTLSGDDATGNVSFLANGKLLGSKPVHAGLASFTTTSLPAGINTLTASYSGDATHIAAVSQPVKVTVQAPAPDFSLAVDGNMLSLVNGSTARSNVSIGTNASLNGTLTLSCIGLPLTLQCTFTPATSAVGAGQQATVQLSVTQTTYASTKQPEPFNRLPPAMAGMVTLAGAVCLRKRRRLVTLCGLALVALIGLTGCAGGDGKQVQTVYFTVAAQVASGSTTIVHSTPMQVIVRQ